MGSTEYSTSLDMWLVGAIQMLAVNITVFFVCRGVGCIFVEMLTGKPLFPGLKGVYDQLNRIWGVSVGDLAKGGRGESAVKLLYNICNVFSVLDSWYT